MSDIGSGLRWSPSGESIFKSCVELSEDTNAGMGNITRSFLKNKRMALRVPVHYYSKKAGKFTARWVPISAFGPLDIFYFGFRIRSHDRSRCGLREEWNSAISVAFHGDFSRIAEWYIAIRRSMCSICIRLSAPNGIMHNTQWERDIGIRKDVLIGNQRPA